MTKCACLKNKRLSLLAHEIGHSNIIFYQLRPLASTFLISSSLSCIFSSLSDKKIKFYSFLLLFHTKPCYESWQHCFLLLLLFINERQFRAAPFTFYHENSEGEVGSYYYSLSLSLSKLSQFLLLFVFFYFPNPANRQSFSPPLTDH